MHSRDSSFLLAVLAVLRNVVSLPIARSVSFVLTPSLQQIEASRKEEMYFLLDRYLLIEHGLTLLNRLDFKLSRISCTASQSYLFLVYIFCSTTRRSECVPSGSAIDVLSGAPRAKDQCREHQRGGQWWVICEAWTPVGPRRRRATDGRRHHVRPGDGHQ